MNYTALVKQAKVARKNSHSPYSRFRVGAALLTSDNTIVTGSNIEISTYALTLCAERTAIFKARSEGYKNFKAIAIATDQHEYIPPCGACRQVLMDLAGDIEIILTNDTRKLMVMKLSSLLPMAFGPRNLRHSKR